MGTQGQGVAKLAITASVFVILLLSVGLGLRLYTSVKARRAAEVYVVTGEYGPNFAYLEEHKREAVDALVGYLDSSATNDLIRASSMINLLAADSYWRDQGLDSPGKRGHPDVPIVSADDTGEESAEKIAEIRRWWTQERSKWSASWWPW